MVTASPQDTRHTRRGLVGIGAYLSAEEAITVNVRSEVSAADCIAKPADLAYGAVPFKQIGTWAVDLP